MPSHTLTVGQITLDTEARTVTAGSGEPTPLRGVIFDLLALLMKHAGTTLEDDWLREQLHGGGFEKWPNCESSLRVYVRRLRKALHAAGAPYDLIERDWRRGYRCRPDPDCITRSFTPATWERIKTVAEREGITL
jgi:DNA-binding response OmpR family regulator